MCTAQLKASLAYSSLKPAPINYARIGNIQIVKTLSRSPSCKVKLGKNVVTKQEYLIKVPKSDMASPSSASSDHEAELHGLLSQGEDSNILKLIEYLPNTEYIKKNGSIRKVYALIMESAEEGDLFEYLQISGAISEETARTHFDHLINALQNVHDRGIIHMNLRPENLLFTKDLVLKIIGFSLSTFAFSAESLEHFGFPKAIDYSAPEVIEKNKSLIGYSSDIFSCGVILFTMVAGHPPFNKASAKDDYFKLIIKGQFSTFWQHHERRGKIFSSEFKDLINGMLANVETERPSIAEIKAAPWFNGSKHTVSEIKEDFNRKKEAETKTEKKEISAEQKVKKAKALFLLNQAKTGQAHKALYAMQGIKILQR